MSVKDVKFQTGVKDIQNPYFVNVTFENDEEVKNKNKLRKNECNFLLSF
jgi:hypothetical protein